ncbi:ParM/StbA family protein [Oceanobacillus damuensis]|uniref:ParM/StbA family protein n=1 Tax=Oceanobacillus damuensis TaxID=937928 RepID=UPI0008372898|nr:ParM/StbA family protein [Oceanobacillus damuensis]
MENVAVDLGYGYVKAIASSGKRVVFPSLVGKGYARSLTSVLGDIPRDMKNIHLTIQEDDYFVGELATESRSVSRIFERERFSHVYTKILLNTAIQLVSDSEIIHLSTGLPLDFYQSQAKEFRQSVQGMQPVVHWLTGPFEKKERRINIRQALVFPQGASAIFSALINHEGRYTYPHLMKESSLIALIDIGFRTTDFVVVEIQENGSFIPMAKLSGTVDEGVINLHRDIRQAYKVQTGGADLNEFFISRILTNENLRYKGKSLDFSGVIYKSKQSIAANIADRLKAVWAEESDLFDGLFLAGGGGELFEPFIQPHFDNRMERINECQFANAIGYLRLRKAIFDQQQKKKLG